MRMRGKTYLCQALMTGDATPYTCVRELLRQTLMTQMAGDPLMRTQGLHAPALEPGSAALRVARRITFHPFVHCKNLGGLRILMGRNGAQQGLS